VIVALPVIAIAAVVWIACAIVLLSIVWLTWIPRGRRALVVYSSSPVWQSYFESRVLPALGSRALVLNWSERKTWGYSLPALLFHMFAGSREFNPLALVFEPLRWPRRLRFYRPFAAFKHGRPDEVESLRAELFRMLDVRPPGDAA
jgi:hypothetical protein